MRYARPVLHGRDHVAGGADPIPGLGTTGGFETLFNVAGALSTLTGNMRWYARFDGEITEVYVSVGTAPTGSGTTVRLNKNGSSLGTVTIAAGSNTNSFTPASPTFVIGDYFTVDITAVGSTTPGSDLDVQIIGSRS